MVVTYKMSAVFSGNYPTLRMTEKAYNNAKPPTNYVRYLVRKQKFSLKLLSRLFKAAPFSKKIVERGEGASSIFSERKG